MIQKSRMMQKRRHPPLNKGMLKKHLCQSEAQKCPYKLLQLLINDWWAPILPKSLTKAGCPVLPLYALTYMSFPCTSTR